MNVVDSSGWLEYFADTFAAAIEDAATSEERDDAPLAGTLVEYIDPAHPVAGDDWDAVRRFRPRILLS